MLPENIDVPSILEEWNDLQLDDEKINEAMDLSRLLSIQSIARESEAGARESEAMARDCADTIRTCFAEVDGNTDAATAKRKKSALMRSKSTQANQANTSQAYESRRTAHHSENMIRAYFSWAQNNMDATEIRDAEAKHRINLAMAKACKSEAEARAHESWARSNTILALGGFPAICGYFPKKRDFDEDESKSIIRGAEKTARQSENLALHAKAIASEFESMVASHLTETKQKIDEFVVRATEIRCRNREAEAVARQCEAEICQFKASEERARISRIEYQKAETDLDLNLIWPWTRSKLPWTELTKRNTS